MLKEKAAQTLRTVTACRFLQGKTVAKRCVGKQNILGSAARAAHRTGGSPLFLDSTLLVILIELSKMAVTCLFLHMYA